jgi:squalene monooxygenase
MEADTATVFKTFNIEPFIWSIAATLLYFIVLAVMHFASKYKEPISTTKRRTAATSEHGDSTSNEYDVIVVGAGIVGTALSSALARDGRKVLCVERDLSEPDRIVGELLQPGGVAKLTELEMECKLFSHLLLTHIACLEGIDSPKMNGYGVFYDGDQVDLFYPPNRDGVQPQGRSFHYGRFIMKLREHARAQEQCKLVQGTVMKFIEEASSKESVKTVRGVVYRDAEGRDHTITASLTIVANGAGSSLTKCFNDSKPIVPSHFIGLKMKNAAHKLPCPWRGNVFMTDPSPVLLYPISSTDVRCLVDYPGKKLPNIANGDMRQYLLEHIMKQLPSCVQKEFEDTVNEGNIRTVPNREMPAAKITKLRGALLVGDAFNCRHPLTGGGMSVGLADCVLLRDLLRQVEDLAIFEDIEESVLPAFYQKRKATSSTINILANALYAIFAPNNTGCHGTMVPLMRTSVVRYFKIGGACASGPVGLLGGLIRSPYVLLTHFFSVALVGCWDQVFPIPSPNGIWRAINLLKSATQIVGPLIAEEGLLKFVFHPILFNRNQELAASN